MRILLLLAIAAFACAPGNRPGEAALPWESWRPAGVVGDTLSTSDATIGTVLATALTSRGELLVLDGAEKRVLAFDAGGQLLARGAGVGDGPGELRDPVSLLVIAGDSVALVDRTLRRIEVLTPVADGLRPARSVSLDFAPAAACLLEDDLFVLGGRGGAYLHRLTAAGDLIDSWSPVPADSAKESQDAIAGYRRFALGGGQLACDTELGMFLHAPDAHGEVYGIRPGGRMEWTQPIDSLVLPVIVARPNGVRFDLDPVHGYAEHVLRVTPLGAGQAQLLIRRRFARDANREPELRAIVLDVASGALLRRVQSPRHFGFTTQEWATEHLEEPAPAVVLWRR
jgi:hypothetical protein